MLNVYIAGVVWVVMLQVVLPLGCWQGRIMSAGVAHKTKLNAAQGC